MRKPFPCAQLASLWLLCLLGSDLNAAAAELATVPMQGSMLMPTVWYHADTDSVTVGLEDIIVTAQLTPLLVSHPNDWFNSLDPWFESLDPSRKGLAFSRRYGFTMHVMTDLLLPDRELWIRKLSSSPGLSFYDYNDFISPKSWNPIFGTAATTNATYWSGLMWHIGVTAPPSTNRYTSTFEIFVMNTATGQPVPNSSSGPFQLEWTCVSDDRPALAITNIGPGKVQLLWPAASSNWTLRSASASQSTNWQNVAKPPDLVGDELRVTLDASNSLQFYRLQLNR